MTFRFAGPNSQTRLARLVDTDQTTLSRNLKLLLAERWVEPVEDKADARRRIYRITKLGLAALSEAQQLWHNAHDQMERSLGAPMAELWPMLDRILAAART
jgi:DNA-binding MarR family transcriptional regulator